MINVTKTFLPPLEEYQKYLKQIWESRWATNHGPFALKLEEDCRKFLSAPYLRVVNNGTVALQVAFKALELKEEVITTPFSYVATTSSLGWEGLTPIFADIDADDLTIDPREVEKKITSKTSAILATHVYGNSCQVDALQKIATQHGLKIIYDAAHAFGTRINKKSVFEFGDISTCSFHATKLFHTVEGGAIISQSAEIDHRISYLYNFGHNGPEDFHDVGINGKISEFHAAMGLCLLPRVNDFIERRKAISDLYDKLLLSSSVKLRRPKLHAGIQYNYAYYPIVFETEESLLKVVSALAEHSIRPRRYFYPSLNTVKYLPYQKMPVSEDISRRVLCLPLFVEMEDSLVNKIGEIVLRSLRA